MISDFIFDHIGLCIGLGASILCCATVLIPMNLQWSEGERKLTGYVYSANDGFGNKTTGHIRFSEYAGNDSQPSFCVEKKDGGIVKELAGSGKKVTVTIPAGFAWAPLWDCAIPAKIEVVEEGNR